MDSFIVRIYFDETLIFEQEFQAEQAQDAEDHISNNILPLFKTPVQWVLFVLQPTELKRRRRTPVKW